MKRFISLISLAGVLAFVGGCAKEEDPVQHEPQASEDVFVTLSSGVRFAPDTRAITEDGVKTFGQDDRIAVVYTNTNNEPATAVSGQLVISEDGKSASFTVLLQNPKEGEVSYVYPSTMADESALSAQDGTFAGLQALDYAKGTGEITGSGANALLPSGMVLTNQLAVVKFTIKDEDGTNDITANLIGLTASDGTSTYHINREAGPGPIYLALRPASGDIKLTAFDATQNYVKFLHGKTLSAGSLYPIVLQMPVVTPPVNAIRGLFTVNEAGTQVYFSRGNLRATGTAASTPESGWTWSFAEHQYDALGNCNDNKSITGLGMVSQNATIDLFGWSAPGSCFGIDVSTSGTEHYLGRFVDWGIIFGEGWRTLTKDEWNYLFYGRPNADQRIGVGRVGNTPGLFLLPDVFADPKTNTGACSVGGAFVPQIVGAHSNDQNSYPLGGNWEAMEAAGAVFLPITLHRAEQNSIANPHEGVYWTSSLINDYEFNAFALFFSAGPGTNNPELPSFANNGSYRYLGMAVRLVNRVSPIVDLSQISADYQAMDGDVLINTLASNCKISVAPGATITLRDANINGSGSWTSGDYAGLTCEGDATLILEGTSTVHGFNDDYPGVYIAPDKTLTIQGVGMLIARSSSGAGIGGGDGISCGNILIKDGTVIAQASQHSAGIGGGRNASCGTICIEGGQVTAQGGDYAAGIGAGMAFESNSACSDISISGGKVIARGGDGAANYGAAGIGSGNAHSTENCTSSCGSISITAGTVEAYGGPGSPAIGAGTEYCPADRSECGVITITPCVTKVTATQGGGAGLSIGRSANMGECEEVIIGNVSYYNSLASGFQNGGESLLATNPFTYPSSQSPTGSISGLFSVSDTKQVYFSQGNLQATTSDLGTNWIWSFAERQWDIIGNNAANSSIDGNGTVSENGTVDLFGWSTASTYYGIYNGTTTSGYSGDFVDWGGLTISNGGTESDVWKTLSVEEWNYLLDQRTTLSGIRFAKAWIYDENHNSIEGILLLPDNWSTDYYPVFHPNDKNKYFNSNIIDYDKWERRYGCHGAVFLPVGGVRNGNAVSGIDSNIEGNYWCRDFSSSTSANRLHFIQWNQYGNAVYTEGAQRRLGCSVRLARYAN